MCEDNKLSNCMLDIHMLCKMLQQIGAHDSEKKLLENILVAFNLHFEKQQCHLK